MVGIIEYIDDPIMLIILFIGVLVGLLIRSRWLIIIVFALAAMSGLKHYLMGNFVLENTLLASILFVVGMVLVAFVIIYQVLVKIEK
jgi:hypothetical protein